MKEACQKWNHRIGWTCSDTMSDTVMTITAKGISTWPIWWSMAGGWAGWMCSRNIWWPLSPSTQPGTGLRFLHSGSSFKTEKQQIYKGRGTLRHDNPTGPWSKNVIQLTQKKRFVCLRNAHLSDAVGDEPHHENTWTYLNPSYNHRSLHNPYSRERTGIVQEQFTAAP